MKPLELSSVAGVWKSAIAILETTQNIGTDVQIWFPWGKIWRGYDSKGGLPPTELPSSLISTSGESFAGRIWFPISVSNSVWLVCFKHTSNEEFIKQFELPSESVSTFNLLGEFVKMECLLGLTLRILENCAHERTGHWDRVRHLAVAMGKQMKLSATELFELELAALLHDIGKVALPPAILSATRPLSAAERKQIESHSTIGAGMIREIPGMERIAEYVLYHHETPDGTGYPRGLRGEEIPLISLIIGAADAFDAMTHYRPYASERSYSETIKEMLENTGKFDDRVLWSLQEVLKSFGILDVKPGFSTSVAT